jgi:hypothetical protein
MMSAGAGNADWMYAHPAKRPAASTEAIVVRKNDAIETPDN